MMRIIMKIMNNSSYQRVLATVATKQFQQFFYKNEIFFMSLMFFFYEALT